MTKRPSTFARGYDKAWYRAKALYLRAHPRCVMCQAKATDVDHIKTIRERPDLRMNQTNWRALCHACHAQRTAQHRLGRGPRACDDAGNPLDHNHPWRTGT
jgi:5-methylcytosine-specific restriction endonuclease McrA